MEYLGLLDRFGSPLYVYDAAVIRRKIAELKTMTGALPAEFLYAIKANFNPHIVKLIVEEGFGIDAVSVEEVKIALKVGCAPEKIMYTENNMSDAEMLEAARLGVLINFNSLYRLKEFGKKFPGTEVSVRFNPNVGAASHDTNITGGPKSKFGINYDRVDEVLEILNKYGLRLVGVHEHIGSGWLEEAEPLLAMDVIFDVVKELQVKGAAKDLRFIDFGGGFGVPYAPGESRLNLEQLGEKMQAKFGNFLLSFGRDLKMRFEPGRYVVAESGALLAKVTCLKRGFENRVFVGLDTGMNHLARVALYDAYHPVENLTNPNGELRVYDVCGNICECADFFAKDRELNEVRVGDVLKIGIAGAYGVSMANNYQFRLSPIEVLLDGVKAKIIRKKQNFEEQFNNFGFDYA